MLTDAELLRLARVQARLLGHKEYAYYRQEDGTFQRVDRFAALCDALGEPDGIHVVIPPGTPGAPE